MYIGIIRWKQGKSSYCKVIKKNKLVFGGERLAN